MGRMPSTSTGETVLRLVLLVVGLFVVVVGGLSAAHWLDDWMAAYMTPKQVLIRTQALATFENILISQYALHVDAKQFYTRATPKGRSHNGIVRGVLYRNIRATTGYGECIDINFKLTKNTDELTVYQVARKVLPLEYTAE